jgi:hypothetical protein
MSELKPMKRSGRVLAIASLALTGCWDGSSSCPYGECNGYGYGDSYGAWSGDAACVDWNSYDDNWHRRHCGESYWVWCNAPDASSYAASGATSGSSQGSSGTGEGSLGSATSSGSTAGAGGGGPGGNAGSGAGSGAGGGGADTDGGGGAAAADGSGGAATNDGSVGGAAAGDDANSEGSAACTNDVCICQRDDDCPATEVCDHTTATCVAPPPACSALTTEAVCTTRADCSPVYGGMNCSNDMGTSCQSGEANCTCASYSFAACANRGP